MKARYPELPLGDPTTSVVVAIDGRSKLVPPLPSEYIGCATFECFTFAPLSVVTSPKTHLSVLATMIRKSLQSITSENLASAVALASVIPDMGNLRAPCSSLLELYLATTSWLTLPVYELNWGNLLGGHIDAFRVPKGQFDGLLLLLPRAKDGAMEVVIGLEEEKMQRLRKDLEMNQYVDQGFCK
jgi:hypothetical protein